MLLSKGCIIYTSSTYKLYNSLMRYVWQRATAGVCPWLLSSAVGLRPQSCYELSREQLVRQQLMNEQLPFILVKLMYRYEQITDAYE